MHDDILCVIMRMAPNKEQSKENTESHKGVRLEGDRSNKAQCGNQGSPTRIPRDHREQPLRHNIHPGHFEANTDNAGRNENGEKRKPVKQEGETWSIVKNDSSSYGTQGALRVRSVVLFQASASWEL